ncbi:MAG TPA: ribonuclease H [Ensifer sp.]|nr:ribonuclease H [Ensifer sp.]
MINSSSPFAGQRHYVLATDGSAIPNPGPGGWGVIRQLVEANGTLAAQRPFAGRFHKKTTNIRMEMLAVIKGLSSLDIPHLPVLVISDNQMVVKGATEWMSGWKERGWRKSDKSAVENLDLWLEIDALMQTRPIEWLWVRGHDGHVLNEMVDVLAKNATRWVYAQPGRGMKDLHGNWFLGLDALTSEAA